MLKLTDVLAAHGISLEPGKYKVHLATASHSDPLEEFFQGRFKQWQERQGRKNFECDKVVSLIRLAKDRWLFAGVYLIDGRQTLGAKHISYDTTLLPGLEDCIGRVIVRHRRKGRQAYVYVHDGGDAFLVSEILPERMIIEDFPGFDSIHVSHSRLQTIIRQKVNSWRGALANIKGVYLIADRSNGKLYVGSAIGADGIWDRWRSYAETGHGGNAELRVMEQEDPGHSVNYTYSILEIADTHTSDETILQRESYWKDILLSRTHGYNKN